MDATEKSLMKTSMTFPPLLLASLASAIVADYSVQNSDMRILELP